MLTIQALRDLLKREPFEKEGLGMKQPMTQRNLILGLILVILAPLPLLACSLCGSVRSQDTLGEELERAKLVVYGRAVSSELFSHEGATPGSGRTELQIDRVLKNDPLLGNNKGLILGRWLPVQDRKNPPRYLVFCSADKGQLDAYLGREVRSDAVLAYLEGAGKARSQGRVQALQYYFNHLDSSDEMIAGDAFLEFARANDQEVDQVRRSLKPDKIRALLQNPGTKPEFLGLLAFLLGGCGEARDADYLLSLLQRNDESSRKARDGVLAGYLSLKPREGWELLRSHVGDGSKAIIPDRLCAINAVRFCYTLKMGEYRQGALRCLEAMVPDGDAADFAVEDLRKWQIWDLTPLVLAQYHKKSHAVPIIRRAIVRYALSCPQAEARQFLDRIRAQDHEMIRQVEEGLQFEK
jgi:hypothetical protein